MADLDITSSHACASLHLLFCFRELDAELTRFCSPRKSVVVRLCLSPEQPEIHQKSSQSYLNEFNVSSLNTNPVVEVTDIEGQVEHSLRKPKSCRRVRPCRSKPPTVEETTSDEPMSDTSHDDVTEADAVEVTGHTCTICGDKFLSQDFLEKHLNLHRKSKFVCQVRSS